MKKAGIASIIVLLLGGFLLSDFQAHIRDTWEQPDKVMDTAGVQPGMVIGEVGAGHGYFTFHLSRRVGDQGKIYANDIVRRKLVYIDRECHKSGIDNIETILGEVENPLFPESQLDMVFMVNVFHDLEKPVELLNNLAPALKPKATVVIVDRDPEKFSDSSGHFLTQEAILEKIKESVFELVRIETFLPQHNIYILSLKERGLNYVDS